MQTIIEQCIAFVKLTLNRAESGHDWWHVYRVWQNSIVINKEEKEDSEIVEVAALLHDIADAKFHNGDETLGSKISYDFLIGTKMHSSKIDEVVKIVDNISFRGGFAKNIYQSMALNIVRDADKLDAIGAIGIARTFSYGGYKNRVMFDPKISPTEYKTASEYRKNENPTINHFYEKLLKLKDSMATETGKQLAKQRHQFMLSYLEQFFNEWPEAVPNHFNFDIYQ
ncbi:MAG: HD domain-containing protein [Bacteroidales bacterium]|nr:HD domain-containing protein [Bacteroidales bacterium]